LGGTEITINGGTFDGRIQTTGYIGCGIYHPQDGILTVNGGLFMIPGGVGAVIRAGQATFNGGTFNVVGTGQGFVGDSKNIVETTGIFVDGAANYPGWPNCEVTINNVTVGGMNKNAPKVIVTVPEGEDGHDRLIVDTDTFSGNIEYR